MTDQVSSSTRTNTLTHTDEHMNTFYEAISLDLSGTAVIPMNKQMQTLSTSHGGQEKQ